MSCMSLIPPAVMISASRLMQCNTVNFTDIRLLRNLETYELMIRGILDLPSKPAIINMQ